MSPQLSNLYNTILSTLGPENLNKPRPPLSLSLTLEPSRLMSLAREQVKLPILAALHVNQGTPYPFSRNTSLNHHDKRHKV